MFTFGFRLFYSAENKPPSHPPSHTLSWKPLGFLSHVKCRTNDDRFPLVLWEVWFCSQVGVPIPDLIGSGLKLVQSSLKDKKQTPFCSHSDWTVEKLTDLVHTTSVKVKTQQVTMIRRV
jgi:hypothetical protein